MKEHDDYTCYCDEYREIVSRIKKFISQYEMCEPETEQFHEMSGMILCADELAKLKDMIGEAEGLYV